MLRNRRFFLASSVFAFIAFKKGGNAAKAQEREGWFVEFTDTIQNAVSFVDDLKEALRQQGIRIDREELKPFVRVLNVTVNELRSSLINLRDSLEKSSISDHNIVARAADLSSLSQSMIFAVEGLFRNASEFDTSLERYRNAIYGLSEGRSASVDRIRLIVAMPTGDRINRDSLEVELNTAIEISDLLLSAIQTLAIDLG
ncbi:MAG: hypothetical protein AAFV90_12930 [Cyanobacteria bacterium J06634_5]